MANAPLKQKPLSAARPLVLPFTIAAAALALRLLYIRQIQNTPLDWGLVTDSSVYERAARDIAAGNFAYSDYAIINPFYPFFAALFYRLFGFHNSILLLVQAVAEAASVLLIYYIAKHEFRAISATIASSAYALYRMAIFYSGIRIATTLEIFLALAFAALLLRLCRGHKTYHFVLPGLLGGILGQARANFFLVFGVVSLWLLLRRRRDSGTKSALTSVASLYAGLAIVLCLLSLRNYSVSGHASPFVNQSGLMFYIGNNPRATGFYTAPAGIPHTPLAAVTASVYLAKRETGRDLTAAEASQYWFTKAMGFIRSHPAHEVRLLAKKLLLFFRKEEAPLNVVYDLAFQDVPLLRLPLVPFGLVAPLALVGVALAVMRRRASFLLIYLFSYVGSVIVFFISGRYRLPVLPVLLIFAGYGAEELGRFAMARHWRALGLSLAALSGFALVSAYDLPFARYTVNPAAHYGNLGATYFNRGFNDKAAGYFRKAIQMDSSYTSAYYTFGLIYEKTRPDSAVALFQKTIALDPLHAKAHLHLGVLLAAGKEPEKAAEYFARTLALDPSSADAHAQLGDLLMDRGLFAQALEHYTRALAVNPKNADAWFNAGAACYGMKSYGQALEFFAGYLRLAPGDSEAVHHVSRIKAMVGKRGN